MSDHALLSPSSAKRWLNCTGSIRECKDKPRTDTEFSLRGTFGHDVAAFLLFKDTDSAKTEVGRKSADGKITFDEQLAAAVQVYLNAVRFVVMSTGGDLHVEKRVQLTPQCGGTPDALVWSGDFRRLDVFDLKLGAGVYVDVESNEQMMVYALAAMAEVGRGPGMVDEVNLHIVQPLYTGAEAHRTYSTEPGELQEFRERIAQAHIDIAKPDAPLVAGEWCRFCPAKDGCPALHADALAGAQDIFDDLTPQTPVKAPPLLETMPVEHLALILSKADAMESLVDAIRKHARGRAMAGEKIPGHKLVERKGHRKWTDESLALTALKSIGVDPWAPQKLISPSAAEKATKAAKEITAKLAAATVSGVSLVKMSDRRKELTTLPSTDIFDELPE